eukprot:6204143-Pleurochrysis_carterae.AAC.1
MAISVATTADTPSLKCTTHSLPYPPPHDEFAYRCSDRAVSFASVGGPPAALRPGKHALLHREKRQRRAIAIAACILTNYLRKLVGAWRHTASCLWICEMSETDTAPPAACSEVRAGAALADARESVEDINRSAGEGGGSHCLARRGRRRGRARRTWASASAG